jgi:uncharacterized protein (TIGR02722 family)
MKTREMSSAVSLGAAALILFSSGCAMFRSKVQEVDVNEKKHLRADYDYSDMRAISEEISGDLLASPFMGGFAQPPIMMIAGVQNRTSQYVDTKNLTDRMRNLLLQSQKIRFVNETRRDELLKEQGFSAANATPETQVAIGNMLGARYMMSGSLTEMESKSLKQVRVSKTEVKYYKLTFEITDIQSGEICWSNEKEFAREARLPLIGW